MKVSFYTLGCKVNQHETGALQQLFYENGYEIVNGADVADVYVVNSCTVTAGGEKRSRQWLRRAKRENPAAVTVLCGCYPQAFPEEAALSTEADVICGSKARGRLVANVQKFMRTGERIVEIIPHAEGDLFEELPVENFVGHTRAFIKIEDGCNRSCAYCVIPRARGRVRSRDPESVLEELRGLAAAGYREVVLSGINLSCYGTDNGSSLAEIVEKAAAIEGIERIRLGSTEPDLLSDETLERLAKVKKLCCQFHLSLQSGCDATLKRMNRLYTAADYAALLEKMRRLFDRPVFTTDVIVGFPGETEEEFVQSMEFVKAQRFMKVHVFPYSRRPGTPAATMPCQVDEQEKSARSKRMIAACDEVRAELIRTEWEGTREEVLLEKPVAKDQFTGYTKSYIPVLIYAAGGEQGQIVPCTLGEFDGMRCTAKAD